MRMSDKLPTSASTQEELDRAAKEGLYGQLKQFEEEAKDRERLSKIIRDKGFNVPDNSGPVPPLNPDGSYKE